MKIRKNTLLITSYIADAIVEGNENVYVNDRKPLRLLRCKSNIHFCSFKLLCIFN